MLSRNGNSGLVRLSVAQPRPLTNSRVAAAAFGANRGHWNGSISCYPLARSCANPMSKARVLSFSKADSAARSAGARGRQRAGAHAVSGVVRLRDRLTTEGKR